MRILLIPGLMVAFGVLISPVRAQSWPWSADDFEPLTSLPWKAEDVPAGQVITRIFREPRLVVRRAVLQAYLETMRLQDFDAVLNQCARLEGRNNPDDMVALVLTEWTRRDIQSAWKRTQGLFDVCVLQGDPLSLDRWSNPKIVVTSEKAIRRSPFWLDGGGLAGFARGSAIGPPIGNDGAPSPSGHAQRQEILHAFSKRYIDLFDAIPVAGPGAQSVDDYDCDREIVQTLACEHNDLTWIKDRRLPSVVNDVAAIRWLTVEPSRALHVLEHTTETPSAWFLQIWKRLDFNAMKAWAESAKIDTAEGARARGMLMSKVDAATRERWLADERKANDGVDDFSFLLNEWAIWSPQDVLPFLASLKPAPPVKGQTQEQADGDFQDKIGDVLKSLVYTDDQMVWNRCRYGMKVLADADWSKFPAFMTKAVIEKQGISMMEQWCDVDVGQAARFSFKLITSSVAQAYFPRSELIKEFAGGEPFSGDDFNDRCFCALRFWAMWKPDEMKAWIAAVEGEDMRKALTWLLEHPWGTGSGPE